jgi:hypothetical protein
MKQLTTNKFDVNIFWAKKLKLMHDATTPRMKHVLKFLVSVSTKFVCKCLELKLSLLVVQLIQFQLINI